MLSSNDRLDDKGNIENNILSNKPVSANQQVNENESGAKMVDDSFVSKWCAEHINEQNPGEAVIDMRGTYELSKLQLFHATYAHDNEISGADGRDKDKNWNTRTSVSYTHLDVYKRQHLHMMFVWVQMQIRMWGQYMVHFMKIY